MRPRCFPRCWRPPCSAPAHRAAADLPRAQRAAADYYSPPPVFSWQGFYLGINGGYALGAFQNGSENLLGKPNGWVVGGTAGYNLTFAPTSSSASKATSISTARRTAARLSPASPATAPSTTVTIRAPRRRHVDRALLFVTGGFAGSNHHGHGEQRLHGFYGQQSKVPARLVARRRRRIRRRAQSLGEGRIYLHLGRRRSLFRFLANALQTNIDTSTIRGGVNYHF